MTVYDLILASSISNYHVLDGAERKSFAIDHVDALLADYGQRRIYIISSPEPDTIEIILHQDNT